MSLIVNFEPTAPLFSFLELQNSLHLGTLLNLISAVADLVCTMVLSFLIKVRNKC